MNEWGYEDTRIFLKKNNKKYCLIRPNPVGFVVKKLKYIS